MKATTIKSFILNGKALVVTVMFLAAGNMEAASRRFLPIEGGPIEREWIPKIIGRFFELISAVASGVLEIPPG